MGLIDISGASLSDHRPSSMAEMQRVGASIVKRPPICRIRQIHLVVTDLHAHAAELDDRGWRHDALAVVRFERHGFDAVERVDFHQQAESLARARWTRADCARREDRPAENGRRHYGNERGLAADSVAGGRFGRHCMR